MTNAKKLTIGSIASLTLLFLTTAATFAANTVNTADIVNGAVTSAKIATGTIVSSDLGNNSVGASELKANAVGASEIAANSVGSSELAANITLSSLAGSTTRATGATGSFQTLAGDLEYEGAAGGTSYYHGGVMGNFLGDNLTNTTSSLHAGVIGSYNVTTDDDNTGASAGVIGEVGDLADSASNAVMAILGGDGGALVANAAYGVQYFNSTAGSHFNYGLDLFHAATADYTGASAVEYGTADIRLASGATISSGSAVPATCVRGSLFLDTDGGADATLRACTATDTWTAVSNE